jgi:hypothetical protein
LTVGTTSAHRLWVRARQSGACLSDYNGRVAAPDTPDRKLEKFEDLAKRLLKVPKVEVDEAERERVKRKRRRPQTS